MAMRRQAKQLYEFGPFRIDIAERHLMREGNTVPLTPKAFDTLMVLVETEAI
jgi:DNA-binding response OmpR family regulator